MDEKKSCQNCRWRRGHGIMPQYNKCHHPNAIVNHRIAGDVYLQVGYIVQNEQLCGPNAKWWERRRWWHGFKL